MLIGSSITLILLITALVACYTYIKGKQLTPMTGMMISMTTSMMTGMALGTILGIMIKDKDLTLPTIISVSIGMMVGYISGRPVSLIASLDGITAGIMGGMMGAMLGVMTQPSTAEMMIYFIDGIYLLVNIVLFRVIDEETKLNQKGASNKIGKFFIFVVLVAFMGFLISLNVNLFFH